MKTSTLLYFWLFAILAGLGVSSLRACSECEEQTIRFKGYYCAQSAYTIQIADGVASGTAGGSCSNFTNSTLATAKMFINVEYPITFTGSACTHHISFVDRPESCYELVVKGGEYSEWTPVTELNHASENSSQPSPQPNWVVMIVPKGSLAMAPGEGQGELGSVKWRFGLGRTASWQGAGFLKIDNALIDASAISTASLQIIGNPASSAIVDVIRTGGAGGPIRQVKTPEALADVQSIANGYEIRYYRLSSVGAMAGGVYTLIGTPVPFVTWRVSSTTANQLQVAKLFGPVSSPTIQSSSLFVHNPGAQSWTLSEGDGSTIARSQTRTIATAPNGNKQVIREWKNESGVQSAKTIEEYQTFSWGEEKVAHIENADGLLSAPRTTTYSYYPDAPGTPSSRQLKVVGMPDGSFQKMEYPTTDSIKTFEPIQGGTADPNLADETNSKTTIRTLQPGFHQEVIETKILGTAAGQRTNARSYESGTWTSFSPTSLSTSSTRRVSNYTTHAHEFGRLMSVSRSDGSGNTYTYDRGDYNSSTQVFTVTPTGKATRSVAEPTPLISEESTRTITTHDAIGHPVIVRTELYSASSWVLLSEMIHTYDTDGNLTQSTKNGTIVYEAVWANRRMTSMKNEAGIETVYTYDAVGRLKTETKKGVAASGSYALQPDIVTTYTYDGSNRAISTSKSAGGITLTTSRIYDGFGRIVSFTDENLLTTTMAYSPDQRVTTVTRPDGQTEITTTQLDGRTASVTGTGVVHRHYAYDYDLGATPPRYKTTEYLGALGLASPRWKITEVDLEGRTIAVKQPGFSGATVTVSQNTYNAQGLLSKTVRDGSPNILYTYTPAGQLIAMGEDLNGDDLLVAGSLDRYTETSQQFQNIGGQWFSVRKIKGFLTNNNATPTVLSEVRVQMSGLNASLLGSTVTLDALAATTSTTITANRPSKLVTETTVVPGSSSNAIRQIRNDLLMSSSTTSVTTPTAYSYDALGRETGKVDPRLASSTLAYVPNKNQVAWVKDHLLQQTSYSYHPTGQAGAGQLSSESYANGEARYFHYDSFGNRSREWGSATYPTETIVDTYGDLWKLRTFKGPQPGVWNLPTWPASPGAAQETIWQRHAATGLLQQKLFPAAPPHPQGGPVYTYHDTYDNRLHTRTWQRGTVTTYGYSNGKLSSVSYNDGTPSVTLTFTRRAQPATVQDASGTRTTSYDPQGNVLDETYSAGLLNGTLIDRTRDAFGRLSYVSSRDGATVLSGTTLTYSPGTGRLENVESLEASAFYTYEPNSDLVKDISFRLGGNERMKSERVWDSMNRLQTIRHRAAANLVFNQSTSLYDNVNRRYRRTQADGTYWAYGYNSRNENTSGERHHSDTTVLPGWEFDYTFDDNGNRLTGGQGPLATYTPNDRNLYSSITHPPVAQILGSSEPAATVTVNGASTTRKANFWHKEISVSPAGTPQFPLVNIQGQAPNSDTQSASGFVTIPPATESPTYDADGNLATDGRWTYTWDGENRLIRMESGFEPAGKNLRRLDFVYDSQSRRVMKSVSENISGSWTLMASILFRYDAWNLLSELKSNGERTAYTWGLDLSGTRQGAGGIGGLLFHRDGTASGSGPSHALAMDETGNVTASVNLETRSVAIRLDYGPFGEVVVKSGGPLRFGWSSKYTDEETGLVYYGYRYYNPNSGKWLSRDPINENGGVNLTNFVGNNSVNSIDPLGLSELSEAAYTAEAYRLIDSGVLDPDEIFKGLLKQYFAADLETDWVWDCQDDMEEIFDALGNVLGDQPTAPHKSPAETDHDRKWRKVQGWVSSTEYRYDANGKPTKNPKTGLVLWKATTPTNPTRKYGARMDHVMHMFANAAVSSTMGEFFTDSVAGPGHEVSDGLGHVWQDGDQDFFNRDAGYSSLDIEWNHRGSELQDIFDTSDCDCRALAKKFLNGQFTVSGWQAWYKQPAATLYK